MASALRLHSRLSPLLLDHGPWRPALNHAYPPDTSCVGKGGDQNLTNWCDDRCLGGNIALAECSKWCDCHTWDRVAVDTLLGFVGSLSLIACLGVLLLDLTGHASSRSKTQSACLRWSNLCNLLYSIYFVLYAGADAVTPMRDMKHEYCDNAWGGLIGLSNCNPDGWNPLCFLNCCTFAVPWLELFGYCSLIWNIMWLVDLVRFITKPLAPEKWCGIPCLVYYHAVSWSCSFLIAFNYNLFRLETYECRQADVVMVPCTVRRQNIRSAMPLIHIVGFGCLAAANTFMLQRYHTAGRTLFRSRPCATDTFGREVRHYLRKQWGHAASLTVCWALILADSSRPCTEDVWTYVFSLGFAGLGLFLSLDRLLVAASQSMRPCVRLGSRRTSQVAEVTSSPTEPLATPSLQSGSAPRHARSLSWGSASPPRPSRPLARGSIDSAGSGQEADVAAAVSADSYSPMYHLVDFAAFLEHLLQHVMATDKFDKLQTGMLLHPQAPVAGADLDALAKEGPPVATEVRLAWLRSAAEVDDQLDVQTDLCVIPRQCIAHQAETARTTALIVVAPRTFRYLRCLWGLDMDRLIEELARSKATDVRRAAKSGCSLLMSSDGRSFTIKTISDIEMRKLRAMLSAYRCHMQVHPDSLLCRIYGAFTFRNGLGSNLHTVLMDCIGGPPGCASMQQFDIKSEFQDDGFCRQFPAGLRVLDGSFGSSASASTCDTAPGPTPREALEADYAFLGGIGVVDYSLLLTVWPSDDGEASMYQAANRSEFARAAGSFLAFSAASASANEAPQRLVARLGIIDFLVPFDMRKKAESAMKRKLLHPRNPDQVTIMDPQSYASRQRTFLLGKVFAAG